MSVYVDYKDSMYLLRNLCANYSAILGKTVFATHVSDGFARIQVQRPGTKIRDPLVDGRVAQLCAIIRWEIAKAEGQLRLAV